MADPVSVDDGRPIEQIRWHGFLYRPEPDITVHELALLLPLMAGAASTFPVASSSYILEHNLGRHFVLGPDPV